MTGKQRSCLGGDFGDWFQDLAERYADDNGELSQHVAAQVIDEYGADVDEFRAEWPRYSYGGVNVEILAAWLGY